MSIRTIAFPIYLLRDEDLHYYRTAAFEVMTDLAGETDAPELQDLVRALSEEIERRGQTLDGVVTEPGNSPAGT